MGFFDNLLNAVESGALEDHLNKFADAVDKTSQQTHGTLKKVADRPAEVLKVAEQKKDTVEEKAQVVKQQVGKSMDIVRKKD